MALFTKYAVVASLQALANSQIKINNDNANDIGVLIGSGIGGIEVIEKQIKTFTRKRSSTGKSFFYTNDDLQYGFRSGFNFYRC